jgi:hypothetical protein
MSIVSYQPEATRADGEFVVHDVTINYYVLSTLDVVVANDEKM